MPECVICQSEMKVEEERLALPCAHTFHKECIEKYAVCKGIPVEQACPCGASSSSPQPRVDLVAQTEVEADSLH